MTKKHEKGGGESRAQKTVEKSERTSSEPESSEGSTGLSGSFITDFPILCEREGVCPIIVVARRQTLQHDEQCDQSVGVVSDSVICQPNSDFFKPKIVADVEDEDDKESVKAIHLRGWLLDESILNVLTLSLPSCSHLTAIKLWNVGLTEQTFDTFSSIVSQFRIKQVSLSGNPIKSENYALLLSDETSLERLSLHGNGLSDQAAMLFGEALPSNKTLIVLDLAHNRISSEGTKHLANALRINRTLLSLSLANNRVDDEGAVALSEVISRFALNRREILARRMHISGKGQAEGSDEHLGAPPSGVTVVTVGIKSCLIKDDINSGEKVTRDKREKTPGVKKRESKREDKGKKDEKEAKSKKALGSAETKKGRGGKGGAKKGVEFTSEEVKMDVLEHVNPLTEAVEEIGGKKYILGNRALTNINLSYNAIGEEGVAALLKAVSFQSTLSLLPGAGLMRLSIEHNSISPDHGDMVSLQELMLTKDPFYKPSDSESVSTCQE